MPLPNSSHATAKRPYIGENSGNISGKIGNEETSRRCHTRHAYPNRGKNGKTGTYPEAANSNSLISGKNDNPTAVYPTGNNFGNNSGNISGNIDTNASPSRSSPTPNSSARPGKHHRLGNDSGNNIGKTGRIDNIAH